MIRINTNKPAKTAPQPRGIRQTMSDLHIWSGLLMGWFLYAMFLTGTVSYFREEISQWMRPEVAHSSAISFSTPTSAKAERSRTMSSIARRSSIVIDTLTSDVVMTSTDVRCRSNTSNTRRMNP